MTFLKENRLFIILSLIIALIDGAFVYLTYNHSKESLQKEQQQQAVSYFSAFDIAYQTSKDNMLQISNIIANDLTVKKLFLEGKRAVEREGGGAGAKESKVIRDALYDNVAGSWQQFSQKFGARQLHFHLGPGSTSFLRVHKPHKFGDNMDTIRHTIVDVNQHHQQVTGFETGRVYSGIRGVSPVFAINEVGEREYVGAVEAGNSFAIVLGNVASNLDINAAVLLYEQHLRKNVWPDYLKQRLESTPPLNGLVFEQTSSELINQLIPLASDGEFIHLDNSNISVKTLNLNDQYLLYASKPLRDYLGSKNSVEPDAGQIVIWRDNTMLYNAFNSAIQNSILYAILAFLIVELLIFYIIKKLSHRLHSIIDSQTTEINSRNYVLEQMVSGAPLTTILEAIIKVIEKEDSSILCSILLIDSEGKHLLAASAPSLPDFYNEAIDGVEIGEGVGSCGSAAFLKKRVIVEDIQTHPYWTSFKELAAKANLGSCWSEPILTANNNLLGTFAIYHQSIRTPNEYDLKTIEFATQLAAIAIEQWLSDEKLLLSSQVFNDAHEGIMITDANGIIVDVNPTFTEITGYSREDVLGENPKILRSGKHSDEFYAEMWTTLTEQGHWQGEVWNQHKNGAIYAETLTISSLNHDGAAQHYVGLFSDITHIKQMEEQQSVEHKNALIRARISQTLQEPSPLKERFEQVLAILCGCDALKTQNKGGVFLLPEGGSELQIYMTHGTFSDDFFLKDECIKLGDCLCGRAAVSGLLKVSDNCFEDHEHERTYDGMTAHGHYIVPLKYFGEVVGILFLFTEPYPVRDPALLEMLSNIGHLLGLSISNDRTNKALVKEKAVAEKANKAKSEFLSSMSHELRTPLNAILGFGQLLESDTETPLTDEQKESVDYIIDSGKHLLDLINQVLELSAIEAHKVNLSIKPIKVIDIVEQCLALMQSNAQQCNIDINVLKDEMNDSVQADYTKIKQIVLNLLSNAIKYNRDNGSVSINWCKTEGNLIKIRVIDTGLGIAKEEQHKVFGAFNRLGQENSNIEGAGIGLVVTKNLVELMGGRIGFESQQGEGTTFWFELPMSDQAHNDEVILSIEQTPDILDTVG